MSDPSPVAVAAEPAPSSPSAPIGPTLAPAPGRLFVGDSLDLNALQQEPAPPLVEQATILGVRNAAARVRHALVNEIARATLAQGGKVHAEGMLEPAPELGGGSILRWPGSNFLPCPEDVFVSGTLTRQHGLRPGQRVRGDLRLPVGGQKDKLMVLERVTAVEGIPVEQWSPPKPFDNLTALFPNERIMLESPAYPDPTVRAIDLVSTLGKGQRGLIVAPPRAGKTVMLKHIARGVRAASPEVHLILLLVDERPEEVTDFRREIDAEIFSSTFDEPSARHIQVAEMVSEHARRLVELGRHVVILLDSITRLARGYNAAQPGKGRLLSGGVETKALLKPKKFFGSARNTEEGGSLTILATALVETNSRMDEVIFEEFKGTGNMELHLDRALLEKRVFPALHILRSGTRREDLLYHPDEFARVQVMRKQLAELPPMEATEILLDNIRATKTNTELLLGGLKY